MQTINRRGALAELAALAASVGGCSARTNTAPGGEAGRVVVYAALDQEFSEPVLLDFARQTRITVLPKFDLESTKTLGLVQAIQSEARRGRQVCDLFWNNEILNTLRLEREGLLQPLDLPEAAPFPAQFRAADGRWFGFAARARVLLVNTQKVQETQQLRAVDDLLDPRWKGRAGIAKPLFGTTATHAACLFALHGPEKAKAFLQTLKRNEIQVLAGNKTIAQAVGAGRLAFGLTDTDDALAEIAAGSPVTIVYPDQHEGGDGTLFIPNTLSVIAGAPHPAEAAQLAAFLLRPEVEKRLALGPSGQIPLNPAVDVQTQVQTPRTLRPMPVDFEAAAAHWDEAAAFLLEEFGASGS